MVYVRIVKRIQKGNRRLDDLDRYKYLLGETVMLYQIMENDLKLMCAGMRDGDFYKNLEHVRSTYKGLGQVVIALEELDNANPVPYFNQDSYRILNKLARQRNYYCHQCCMEFCYNPYFRDSIEFKDSLESLERTNEIIKSVQKQTSLHRESLLTRYNRV